MGLRQGTVASFFFDMLAMDVMEPFSLLEAIATLLHTTTQYISNDERKPRSDPSLDLRRALFFNITTFSPKVRRFPRPRIMPVGHLHESSQTSRIAQQPNASPKILMINFRPPRTFPSPLFLTSYFSIQTYLHIPTLAFSKRTQAKPRCGPRTESELQTG